MYTRQFTLFDGSSDQSSTFTSSSVLLADAQDMSVSISTLGPGSYILEGTNEDGLGTSLTTFSTLSTIVVAGLYAVETGPRWVRMRRDSTDSQSIVQLRYRAP